MQENGKKHLIQQLKICLNIVNIKKTHFRKHYHPFLNVSFKHLNFIFFTIPFMLSTVF